jgi:hypothetical protein
MTAVNNNEMTPLQCAREEWEANTTPCPKKHSLSKFRTTFHIHEFRKFGQAIAWLKWNDDYIEITKLEKLPGAGRRAGTPLIEFLKSIADKHHIRLFGNATIYQPDPPRPEAPLLPQEQLEAWYKKHGFQLYKNIETGIVELWYPNAPQASSDACQVDGTV